MEHGSGNGDIMVYQLDKIAGPDDGDSCSDTDSSQWPGENHDDHYDDQSLRDEHNAGQDPAYVAAVYFAKRKAERKYRAVKGRFMPRQKSKRRFGGINIRSAGLLKARAVTIRAGSSWKTSSLT